MSNYRQLQLGWLMYAHDSNESLTRNVWQDEQTHVQNENWLSGWLDPTTSNTTDNTKTALLLDVKWATLGPYTKSPGVYRCAASRVTCLYWPVSVCSSWRTSDSKIFPSISGSMATS